MRLMLAILLAGFLSWGAASAEPAITAGLRPGPYAVGFKVIRTYDSSRPALPADEFGQSVPRVGGRQMQIAVWYPTQPGRGDPMPFERYVQLNASQVDLRPLTAERIARAVDIFAAERKGRGASGSAITALLSAPTVASTARRPASGRFPLVVYAHIEPAQSSLMAEHLASHGYVVASVPWKGSFEYELDVAVSGVETQARDIAFAISLLKADPHVDPDRIALIGMSFGALGAVATEMRDPDIKAVVSLDGGIGTPTVRLLQVGPYYSPARTRAPLLHVFVPDEPGVDLAWFDDIRYARRILMPLAGLRHEDFVNAPVLDAFAVQAAGDDAHVRGFRAAADMTLAFFDAVFAGHADRFAPVGAEVRPAVPAPPGLTDLKAMVARGGPEAVAALAAGRAAGDPTPIPARDLADLASWLVQTDSGQALKIAELRRQLYPQSADAAYVVAVLSQRAGDAASAQRLYREAGAKLALDYDPQLDSLRRRQIARAAAPTS